MSTNTKRFNPLVPLAAMGESYCECDNKQVRKDLQSYVCLICSRPFHVDIQHAIYKLRTLPRSQRRKALRLLEKKEEE